MLSFITYSLPVLPFQDCINKHEWRSYIFCSFKTRQKDITKKATSCSTLSSSIDTLPLMKFKYLMLKKPILLQNIHVVSLTHNDP